MSEEWIAGDEKWIAPPPVPYPEDDPGLEIREGGGAFLIAAFGVVLVVFAVIILIVRTA
jgi:hypothetical protein